MSALHVFIAAHLTFIAPSLVLGPVVLLQKKGTPRHKRLGRVWAYLMIIGSLLSFGIRTDGHFTWLHGLAAYTVLAVLLGIRSARRMNFKDHQRQMVGSYLGSAIAFLFTLHPERILGKWVLGGQSLLKLLN